MVIWEEEYPARQQPAEVEKIGVLDLWDDTYGYISDLPEDEQVEEILRRAA